MMSRKIFEGKYYLKIDKGSGRYQCGNDMFFKQLFRIFGYSLNIRVKACILIDDGSFCLTKYAQKKIKRMFGEDCVISRNRIICNKEKQSYYMDEMLKFIRHRHEFTTTEDSCVMLDITNNKYYGFSHRACQGFGIGDMLFTEHKEDECTDVYYKNKKYRKEFIKALKKYNRKGDDFMFRECIYDGIECIIPFRKRGTKVIENMQEAFLAAKNFSEYVG